MSFVRNYWLQIVLTLVAFGLGYARDVQDGSIGWGLLLFGTMIAAIGFFGGSYVVKRIALSERER